MRPFVLGMLICLSTSLVSAQSSIRQVDFKNFTYPLTGPLLGHSELRWLGNPKDGYPIQEPIHLANGDDLTKMSSFVIDGRGYTQRAGFTLQAVKYADVTGDGKEDAIVVLRYLTGGTQTTHYVYIYSLEAGKPKLMAYCHTGDRADHGLYRVYGEHQELVFELLNPGKSEGDCCSSRFVRTRYKWQDGRFETFGRPEYGLMKEP